MAQTFDPSQPPLVQETLLKNRRSVDELAYRRSVTVGVQNQRKRIVRGEDVRIKRPEQFVREARIRKGSQAKMERRKRMAEKRKTVAVPKGCSLQNTVGLVVRIHQGRHTSADIKKSLHEFGLNKKYDAVFMKLDPANIEMLKAFDAYVAYGYVSSKSVNELVHRRAFTTCDGGARKELSDNNIVEKVLGDECGLLCLNDLVHELHSVGTHFDKAKGMLCPFKLAAPVGHFEKKILQIHETIETKGGFVSNDDMENFLAKLL